MLQGVGKRTKMQKKSSRFDLDETFKDQTFDYRLFYEVIQ